ncbi:MAG: hypothetical protein J0I24_11565 [Thiomonas arsenitoxydans]|uniref:Uncharacterized protein n=1 Tax=Thiomonas arsenitoxydans (strain DSM 22701 / CIP 110005 / 3As) TaxID=426114 RepID=A0A8I1MWA7_THIA3|nr:MULTISPECIES: hypothetical protein [Thiomonas]MBN8744930.1 hypothetical protein [Thiomonas arsenitoxydans]ODU95519.1 MAG: hypothetical protein ABT24_11905 [Thiomonas sp. SCN 64-16]
MRLLFGLIGLLLTLLIIVWLVRTQLTGQVGVATSPSAAGARGDEGQPTSAALKQFKQSLDKALKARPASVPE